MKSFRKLSLVGASLAVLALLFVAGCSDDDDGGTTPAANHAPQVLSVAVNPPTVVASGAATVTVNATDSDDDNMTYAYAPNGGSITGTGAVVTWNAPGAAGNYSVAVTVTDEHGLTGSGSGNLTVSAAVTGITGTITAPAGVQVDLRNMLVRLYDDFGSYQADAPFTFVTAQGSEYTVNFTFNSIPPGTYYLDAWKDMDADTNYSVGDVWSVYATGAWPNQTVAPVVVTQGQVTNCSAGMITFLL